MKHYVLIMLEQYRQQFGCTIVVHECNWLLVSENGRPVQRTLRRDQSIEHFVTMELMKNHTCTINVWLRGCVVMEMEVTSEMWD